MLDVKQIKKIEDFVSQKPRSVQEIAFFLKKNWRTADRYVDYIKEQFGTVSTRTFRKGTRGALKIVYWSGFKDSKGSVFQEKLSQQLEIFKKKEDFSAFDIYQHINDSNKMVSIKKESNENKANIKELIDFISKTKKQLLVFTGNLSFINLKNKNMYVYAAIENLIKKNVPVKVISRVDLASLKNIKKLLELNFKYGKELIEIRHREQPLRGFISDNKSARIKEIKEPTGKINELNKKVFIFYTIKDKEWVEWLSKNFWNLFSKSIGSNSRIEQMKNFII